MFRLLKYETIKHNFFKPQLFEFVNDSNVTNGPYVTLLIGPNGTGKSQLLESLIKIFNLLSASKQKGEKVSKFQEDFELTYLIDTKHVSIRSIKNIEMVLLNGYEVSLMEIPIPEKILAAAINLNDRFPFISSHSAARNENYEYLGIRTASNNAFKNYNTLLDRFTQSLSNRGNLPRYKGIFDLIGLNPVVSVRYKAGRNLSKAKGESSFEYLKSPQAMMKLFKGIIEELDSPGSVSIRRDKYRRVISNPENLEIVAEFFRSRSELLLDYKRYIRYDSSVSFENSQNVDAFIFESEALRLIRDLEIFSVDKLILYRKNSRYTFEQASSGEHHILSGFINIISTIRSRSLIFIDEPEISLHPNWQIKYMNLLQETFSDYKDCHFVISTHSHFLVSDLLEDKSSVISLYSDDEMDVYNQTLDFDTYGWSAENILYRVFGVSTVRNHYLEMDLRELLSKVSENSRDFMRMRRLVETLRRFHLTPDDPLLKVIETADKYLEKNGH